MNNQNRFNGKGEIYAKARPKYAADLLDYLKNKAGFPAESVFADVGSGTGIFTEQLLNNGYQVFAVEPNEDMRKKAEEKLSSYPNFTSIIGEASDMNLPDHSIDVITTAQAFHWFNPDEFRKECQRVLKPRGKVMIVYNVRDEKAGCTKALADLRQKTNPEFHGFSNGMSPDKCRSFFQNECEVFQTQNNLRYNRQEYINRVLSSSYSLKEGDPGYSEYLKEINRIFDEFSKDGLIEIPTQTVAYIGCV